MAKRILTHAWVERSCANGPGVRAVLWVQGCSLHCPGCFNPETHAWGGGTWRSVGWLVGRLRALEGEIEGLTISGGEPLDQQPAVAALLREVRRETALSVVMFTGYRWDEVVGMDEDRARLTAAQRSGAGMNAGEISANPGPEWLGDIDVLVTGRYMPRVRMARGFSGWPHKRVHYLTNRYTERDLMTVAEAEITIATDGELIVSGVDPVRGLEAVQTQAMK